MLGGLVVYFLTVKLIFTTTTKYCLHNLKDVGKCKTSSETHCSDNFKSNSLPLVRIQLTSLNVCYINLAKHKLNTPGGRALTTYRGRWFPYVQYKGSHTRTLFALWRLKVFKIWIESPMIIDTKSKRLSGEFPNAAKYAQGWRAFSGGI
jgi:hypothetical protein